MLVNTVYFTDEMLRWNLTKLQCGLTSKEEGTVQDRVNETDSEKRLPWFEPQFCLWTVTSLRLSCLT